MNPDFVKVLIDRKTLAANAVLKYSDGAEKGFTLNELRYRLGNCSEFQEDGKAYRLAINYLDLIDSFLEKGQIDFADYVVTRYNSWHEKSEYVPIAPVIT